MTRTFNCAGGVICVTMLLLAGLVLAASSSGGAWPVSTSACCDAAWPRYSVVGGEFPDLSRSHIVIDGVGEVAIADHAWDKHRWKALVALSSAMAGGADGRYDCPGADKIYIVREVQHGGQWWPAVTIIGRTSRRLITAYVMDSYKTPAEARAQVLAYLRDDGCGPLGATP